MPACALTYLDRNQHIHNMEIHAHVSPSPGGGEPWPMWAKGLQRLLLGSGVIDVTDARKPSSSRNRRGEPSRMPRT